MQRIFVVLLMISVISGRDVTGLPRSLTDMNDLYRWSSEMFGMIDDYQNVTQMGINRRILKNVNRSSNQLHSLIRRINMGCNYILDTLFHGITTEDYQLPDTDLCHNINKVEQFFEASRRYRITRENINGTVRDFDQKALWGDTSLSDLLKDIRETFIANKYSSGLLNPLHEFSLQNLQYDCDTQASMQQRIYYMYILLIMSELKGLLTLQQIYLTERVLSGVSHNYVAELDYAKNQFNSRVKEYHDTFIQWVDRFPHLVRRCNVMVPQRGENIIELTGFSRLKFLPRQAPSPCSACPSGPQLLSISEFMGKTVYNCQGMGYNVTACPKESGSDRDYRWWKDSEGNYYGHFSWCPTTQQLYWSSSAESKFGIKHACMICACSADQNESKGHNAAWRISVTDQIADVANNMFVTGVKFVMQNNTLHVQIRQSNYSYDGMVSHKNNWKDLHKVYKTDGSVDKRSTMSYEYLSHNRKTIFLDDAGLPNGQVVVGVRLQPVGSSAIEIQILGSEIEYQSGKLNLPGAKWYSASTNPMRPRDYEHKRVVINLDNSDDPTRLQKSEYDLSSNKMVSFTHTDKNKDAGQTTIPLLDAQPVQTHPSFPLKGVGLTFAGQPGFAGYVSLRIFTVDMFYHMKTLRNVSNDQQTAEESVNNHGVATPLLSSKNDA